VDQKIALELAVISGGGELSPGELVDEFDAWLNSEPEVIDSEKAQLLTALGVGP
jgi:hypothetical protein